ncbi:hypothetical protein ACHAWF_018851 [Thalassiosira exigua]
MEHQQEPQANEAKVRANEGGRSQANNVYSATPPSSHHQQAHHPPYQQHQQHQARPHGGGGVPHGIPPSVSYSPTTQPAPMAPTSAGGASRPDPPEAPGVTGYRQPPLRYRFESGRGGRGGQQHYSGRGRGPPHPHQHQHPHMPPPPQQYGQRTHHNFYNHPPPPQTVYPPGHPPPGQQFQHQPPLQFQQHSQQHQPYQPHHAPGQYHPQHHQPGNPGQPGAPPPQFASPQDAVAKKTKRKKSKSRSPPPSGGGGGRNGSFQNQANVSAANYVAAGAAVAAATAQHAANDATRRFSDAATAAQHAATEATRRAADAASGLATAAVQTVGTVGAHTVGAVGKIVPAPLASVAGKAQRGPRRESRANDFPQTESVSTDFTMSDVSMLGASRSTFADSTANPANSMLRDARGAGLGNIEEGGVAQGGGASERPGETTQGAQQKHSTTSKESSSDKSNATKDSFTMSDLMGSNMSLGLGISGLSRNRSFPDLMLSTGDLLPPLQHESDQDLYGEDRAATDNAVNVGEEKFQRTSSGRLLREPFHRHSSSESSHHSVSSLKVSGFHPVRGRNNTAMSGLNDAMSVMSIESRKSVKSENSSWLENFRSMQSIHSGMNSLQGGGPAGRNDSGMDDAGSVRSLLSDVSNELSALDLADPLLPPIGLDEGMNDSGVEFAMVSRPDP